MSDLIELEVKDKFSKSRPTINRFLGKVVFAAQQAINKVRLDKGYVSL